MPVTMGIVAGGQALLGLGQAVFSGRKKQEAKLDQIANQSPMQMGNKAINDYYEQQMARANANPYQSASYLNSMNNIQNTAASGLNALQGRGAVVGGIGRIGAMSNQAAGNALGQAINQSNQANSAYGHAVGMKSADDRAVWQNNVLDPYQRKLQLQQMKAKAANDRFNNGLNMIGSAASNYAGYQAAATGRYQGYNINPPRAYVGSVRSTPTTLNNYANYDRIMGNGYSDLGDYTNR